MGYIPSEDSREKADRAATQFALDIARVIDVPEDDDHQVIVENVSSTDEGPDKIPFIAAADGDVSLPTPGQFVLVGYARGEKPMGLGVVYTRQGGPTGYSADERTLEAGGASLTLTESGGVEVSLADGESFTINGVPQETPIDNPLSFPHTAWSTGNTENEIWRVNLQSDETLKVYRLETKFKGGNTTDPDFTIDLYDVDDGSVIAETSDVAQGDPIGVSGQGHTVIARITNNTGNERAASINSTISIERT